MRKDQVIKLLEDYNYINQSIKESYNELDIAKQEMNLARELSGVKYSDMPKGSGISNPTEQAVLRIEMIGVKLASWNMRLEKLNNDQLTILNWMDQLNGTERTVIEYKYFKKMHWYQVARVIKYTERQAIRIGITATNKIITYEDVSKCQEICDTIQIDTNI